jgi:hypothetical protein
MPTNPPPAPSPETSRRNLVHRSERHFYDKGVTDRGLGLSRASNPYIHVSGALRPGCHAWAVGWEDANAALASRDAAGEGER